MLGKWRTLVILADFQIRRRSGREDGECLILLALEDITERKHA